MPKIAYEHKRFRAATLAMIMRAEHIIQEYQASGFELTLRQLYYQFVARDWLPNTQQSYNRLGSIINDARLSGMIDWLAVADRTRYLRSLSHWETPADIVQAAVKSYRLDMWENQSCYVEAWIEKDALVDILRAACEPLDVPYFSCRGYVSQSEMWRAACRFLHKESEGKQTTLLHLGDHDPSGVDMSRDIQDRLSMFGSLVEVNRLALTMEQIDELSPPPNPAKITDSRCAGYIDAYGTESWELDALTPDYLVSLVETNIDFHRDMKIWKQTERQQKSDIKALKDAAKQLKL